MSVLCILKPKDTVKASNPARRYSNSFDTSHVIKNLWCVVYGAGSYGIRLISISVTFQGRLVEAIITYHPPHCFMCCNLDSENEPEHGLPWSAWIEVQVGLLSPLSNTLYSGTSGTDFQYVSGIEHPEWCYNESNELNIKCLVCPHLISRWCRIDYCSTVPCTSMFGWCLIVLVWFSVTDCIWWILQAADGIGNGKRNSWECRECCSSSKISRHGLLTKASSHSSASSISFNQLKEMHIGRVRVVYN